MKMYYVTESRRVWIEDYSEKLSFLQADVMKKSITFVKFIRYNIF